MLAQPHGNNRWTADEDAILKRLRAAGETTNDIAEFLRKSRNAVIGRALRKGFTTPNLPRKPINGAPRRVVSVAEAAERRAQAREAGKKRNRSTVWDPLEGSTPVPLEDVCECRWPVTEKRLFCNAPRVEGSSYCTAHKVISEPKNV